MKKKVLLGVTTTFGSDWKEKIKEIKKLKLKEVAFFLTCLNKKEREEFYKLAEKTGVKAPFVHLRSDMDVAELDYLIKVFKTKVFNIHNQKEEFALEYDLSKHKKQIFIENVLLGFSEKEIKEFGGICLDISHLERDRLSHKKRFKHDIKIIERNFIGCNHISAVADEAEMDERTGKPEYTRHFLKDLSEVDYLKKYPLSYFSDYIAIELENTLEEQLKIKERIIKILNSKSKV